MEYLYGEILYLPREKTSLSKPGRILLTRGDKAGETVQFRLKEYPPLAGVRKGTLVRCRGAWNEDVFEIASREEMAPAFKPADIAILVQHELPSINVEGLIEALGAKNFREILLMWAADPQEFRVRIQQAFNEQMALDLEYFFNKQLETRNFASVLLGFEKHGMSFELHQIINIVDLLSHRVKDPDSDLWEEIAKNPFVIAQAEGVPFAAAQELAARLGFAGISQEEVYQNILHHLFVAARNGETYVPVGRIRASVARSLKDKITNVQDIVTDILRDCNGMTYREGVFRGRMRYDKVFEAEVAERYTEWYKKIGEKEPEKKAAKAGWGVYLVNNYFSEVDAAKFLFGGFCQNDPNPLILPQTMSEKAREAFPGLDEKQLEAVESVAIRPVTLIHGRAGTGKTETIAAIIHALTQIVPQMQVVLMAPTGAAARRLTDKTGVMAQTMHMALGLTMEDEDAASPEKEANRSMDEVVYSINPRAIIVDELGMSGIIAFNRLVQKLRPGDRLILAGDPGQLGSPSAGNVLQDLVFASRQGYLPESFACVELTTVHRTSVMLDNLERIRAGDCNLQYSPGLFEKIVTEKVTEAVLDKVKTLLSQGVPAEDIMVLCPIKQERKNGGGVTALNIALKNLLNPSGQPIPGTPFSVGDKVICIENDYFNGGRGRKRRDRAYRSTIYNGMIGVITRVDEDTDTIYVRYAREEEPYSYFDAGRYLQVAYALTVHKAQGAEAPVVILAQYEEDAPRFTRAVLYTALTRVKTDAQKPYSGQVYAIGPGDFLEHAILREERPRYSKLPYRIKKLAGKTDPEPFMETKLPRLPWPTYRAFRETAIAIEAKGGQRDG